MKSALLRTVAPIALGLAVLGSTPLALAAPPVRVADLSPGTGGSFPGWSVVLEDDLVFTAMEDANHTQLYRSDGTPGGTTKLTSIAEDSVYDDPRNLALIGNTIVFRAKGGLWTSDGTAAGTSLMKAGFDIDLTTPFAELAGSLYFRGSSPQGNGVLKTDGTSAGTSFVKAASDFFGKVGTSVVYCFGAEVHAIDGSGTDVLLTNAAGNALEAIGVAGTKLYFSSVRAATIELWATDGTAGGTAKITDVPYTPSAGYKNFGARGGFAYDGQFFFLVTDSTGYSKAMYRTNGTAPGTVLLGRTYRGLLSEFGATGGGSGKLVFQLVDPAVGSELFVASSGTATPTLLADLVPGAVSSAPGCFAPFKTGVAFVARTPIATLVTTDGTTTTTLGPLSSKANNIGSIVAVSKRGIFLEGYDDTAGTELWFLADPMYSPTSPDAGVPPKGDAGPGSSKSDGGMSSDASDGSDPSAEGTDDATSNGAAPAETTTTTQGCAVSGESAAGSGVLLAFAALGLALSRRRR